MAQPRPAARERARALKAQGMPVGKIAEAVGAAQGTVSRWVADVPALPGLHSAPDALALAEIRAGMLRVSASLRAGVRAEISALGQLTAAADDLDLWADRLRVG